MLPMLYWHFVEASKVGGKLKGGSDCPSDDLLHGKHYYHIAALTSEGTAASDVGKRAMSENQSSI